MAGFTGSSLYMQTLKTWQKKLDSNDTGFKVHSHIRVLKEKRDADRRKKCAGGAAWRETINYLYD